MKNKKTNKGEIMKKAILGIVVTESQADRLVADLQSAGFSNEDISVLLPSGNRTTTTTTRGTTTTRPGYDTTTSTEYDTTTGTTKYPKDATRKGTGTLGVEKHSKGPEGGATGATVGGIIGGSLGLLAGIGALAIPGFGPFIAAGPILAALSGSAIGGSLGLFTGYLVGLGIPEFEAKKFEKAVKDGNILVCVHTETSDEVSRAKTIFKKDGAKDVTSTAEKTGSSR